MSDLPLKPTLTFNWFWRDSAPYLGVKVKLPNVSYTNSGHVLKYHNIFLSKDSKLNVEFIPAYMKNLSEIILC